MPSEAQDDPQRFMELNADMRRMSIVRLPLNHGEGCIPTAAVGDSREIVRNLTTEYDALSCGDFPTISAALGACGVPYTSQARRPKNSESARNGVETSAIR
jgi:hypothetical protein